MSTSERPPVPQPPADALADLPQQPDDADAARLLRAAAALTPVLARLANEAFVASGEAFVASGEAFVASGEAFAAALGLGAAAEADRSARTRGLAPQRAEPATAAARQGLGEGSASLPTPYPPDEVLDPADSFRAFRFADDAAERAPGGRPGSAAPPEFATPTSHDATPTSHAATPTSTIRSALAVARRSASATEADFYFLPQRRQAAPPTDLDAPPRAPAAPVQTAAGGGPWDVEAVRSEFPLLRERIGGRPLTWLDNAATTQKPQAMIDRLVHFYRHENSNVHRGAHELAARATDAYEAARTVAARFLNAASSREIVFVRGATEGVNLVAQTWGRANVAEGDEIVISHLEHHANIVPWQRLAAERHARLRVAPVDARGQLLLDAYASLLSPRTRLVAFTTVSNALGTVTPARELAALAHRQGAKVLVDAAQSVAHGITDVQALDADFLVFSGHKAFGPTGIGVLYGKQSLLDAMPPWQSGGNMIESVDFDRTVYQAAPARFEAGTGNIADAVGLAASLEFLMALDLHRVARYEHALIDYAVAQLRGVPRLRLVGEPADRAAVMSFVLEGFAPDEVGRLLNRCGIAVRAGHHCAQPILRHMGVDATVRASLALYNTRGEVDFLAESLRRIAAGRTPDGYLRRE